MFEQDLELVQICLLGFGMVQCVEQTLLRLLCTLIVEIRLDGVENLIPISIVGHHILRDDVVKFLLGDALQRLH